MVIRVEATGSLKSAIPNVTALSGAETVGQVVERLSLPPDVAVAMLVNGRVAHWTTELRDGDVLTLVPEICGG